MTLKRSYLRDLVQGTQVEDLPKGHMLLKEGEICKSIYFIERGQLRTFYNKNGKDINTNFSFENHLVTNLKSFLNATPSAYFIQAAEPTAVRRIAKDELSSLYDQSEEIEAFGCLLLQRLLIRQEEHSNLFKIYNPSERYHYVVKYYPMLLQRVSLSQLSSYLGISRETISRIRKNSFAFSEI